MGQDQEIKIRAIPRSNEKAKAQAESDTPATTPRAAISAGRLALFAVMLAVSAFLLASVFLFPKTPKTMASAKNQNQKRELSSKAQPSRSYDSVNRHLQDAAVKSQMMVRARQMENLSVRSSGLDAAEYAVEEKDRANGVQLDQEDTAGAVFADLNDGATEGYADQLPEDRINTRLANRRWVNELERAERIAFIRNYVREMVEKRGCEPEINQDLIVTGCRPVSRNVKLSIDQIMNRLAKQGL